MPTPLAPRGPNSWTNWRPLTFSGILDRIAAMQRQFDVRFPSRVALLRLTFSIRPVPPRIQQHEPIAATLIPVFLLLATGWGTVQRRIIDEVQWRGFERVTYYILFPALVAETWRAPTYGPSTARRGRSSDFRDSSSHRAAAPCPQDDAEAPRYRWTLLSPRCSRAQPAGTLLSPWPSPAESYGNAGTTLCAVAIAAMIPLLNVLAVLDVVAICGAGKALVS